MILTRPASAAWSALSGLARAASARGWLGGARLPARVISVGNIQVGGAGKTPLVALIAREAHERGLKACILCRGYGGAWEREGGVILPGAAAAPRAADCGDEPALLHELAPHAVIGVGADRAAQFERALRASGLERFDLAVLDDGFQHYKLRKDVEIVALTSARRGETLFRDSDRALRAADLLVWTKGEERPAIPEGRALARVRYRLPRAASASPAWLVTGVADGQSVERSAREAGHAVIKHVSFEDHARYAGPMIRDLISQAAREGAGIVLTGKDWVKWRDAGLPPDELARVTRIEPELEWVEGRDEWNRVLWGR